MISQSKSVSRPVMVVIMASLMAACGGGPSEGEFVAACLREGQNSASRLLDRELGVTRDVFCTCGANAAKSSLSPDAYRVMVLEMQGKSQEAAAITSKMNESEQIAVIQGTAAVFEKCAGGTQ